jgi:hypothetical protein
VPALISIITATIIVVTADLHYQLARLGLRLHVACPF